MKTSELIEALQKSLELNGNQEIVCIVNGKIVDFVDINVPDDKSLLYLEMVD